MLDQLRYKRDVITLESNSGAAALESAVNRLPDFFSTVRSAYAEYLAKPLTSLLVKRDIKWISDKVVKKPYTDLRSLECFTPPGLKVDYLTYGHALNDGAKAMNKLKGDVLMPFNAWLGVKLGNPQSLTSLTTNLGIKDYEPHNTDKLEKAIQACFHTTGRHEVTASYGDVVKRNADWAELGKVCDQLETTFNDTTHQEILDLVNRTTAQMDRLMQRMAEEPENYKISPATLQALATVSYDIGRELEFYGLLRQRISEFSKAVRDTTIKLEDLI
jgi:hypothetical protein